MVGTAKFICKNKVQGALESHSFIRNPSSRLNEAEIVKEAVEFGGLGVLCYAQKMLSRRGIKVLLAKCIRHV